MGVGSTKRKRKRSKCAQKEPQLIAKDDLVFQFYLRDYASLYCSDDNRRTLKLWETVETGLPSFQHQKGTRKRPKIFANFPWSRCMINDFATLKRLSNFQGSLALSYIIPTEKVGQPLLKKIRNLRLDSVNLEEVPWKFQNATSLVLSNCVDASESWNKEIVTTVNLKSLKVVDTFLSSDMLRTLSNLTSLTLFMSKDQNVSFTDEDFQHLPHLQQLVGLFHVLERNTNEAFRHLSNLTSLYMPNCYNSRISDSAFYHLSNLKSLNISGFGLSRITDDAFLHLSNLTFLDMGNCDQLTITDEAFRHLSNLMSLNMHNCDQRTITDEAFRHLSNLTSLNMRNCDQLTITDEAFRHLSKLTFLDMGNCDQPTNDYR